MSDNKTVQDLEAELAAAYASARQEASGNLAPGVRGEVKLPSAALSPADPYAVTTWGSNEYDFQVPSGQNCRLKKLRPEELIGTSILDRITRLPGYAEELVEKSEGLPPKAEKMPSSEDIAAVIEVLDELIPMVVVKPWVSRVPQPDSTGTTPERVPGLIYTDDIELADRIAIMERALNGVKKMDNFRAES